MKRYQSRLALVLALGSMLAPAAGAQSTGAPGDSLAADPRLEVAVTLAEKDRPLGELVAALGRDIHVPLRASRETADDKATLFLDARPAAEVMALIAREFDFQWYHHRDGYELGQTPASRQREADRRERDVEEQLAAIQVEMERRPPLVETPRRQLEEREKEIAQRVQSEDADESERSRLNEERAAIIDTLHPGRAPARAIFRSLTVPQVRQPLAGYDLWLSSADGTLSLPIAEQVQQAQRDAMQLSSWAPFFGFLGRDAWPPAETEVVVRLVDSANDREGPLPPGEPHLRLLFVVPLGPAENREPWGIPGWDAEGKRT